MSLAGRSRTGATTAISVVMGLRKDLMNALHQKAIVGLGLWRGLSVYQVMVVRQLILAAVLANVFPTPVSVMSLLTALTQVTRERTSVSGQQNQLCCSCWQKLSFTQTTRSGVGLFLMTQTKIRMENSQREKLKGNTTSIWMLPLTFS